MYSAKKLAERLKMLRKEKEISLSVLAKQIGVTAQSLSLYENAERTPSADVLYNIAEYFEVSVDYIVGTSDTRSLDLDLQAVCKYTGLSEKAVEAVKVMNSIKTTTVLDECGHVTRELNAYNISINSILVDMPFNFFDDIGNYQEYSNFCAKKSFMLHSANITNRLYRILLNAGVNVLGDDFITKLQSLIMKKQEQYPISENEKEAIDIFMMNQGFAGNTSMDCSAIFDSLRYRITHQLEDFLNKHDARYEIEKLSDQEFLEYIGITPEEFEQLKMPSKGGTADAGDTSAQK